MRASDILHPAIFVKPVTLYIQRVDATLTHRCGLPYYGDEKITFDKGDMLYVRKGEQEGALLITIDHIVGYEGRAVSNPWIDETLVRVSSPLGLLAEVAE